jgi:hypothetical protein
MQGAALERGSKRRKITQAQYFITFHFAQIIANALPVQAKLCSATLPSTSKKVNMLA